jgi:hypothetical protein
VRKYWGSLKTVRLLVSPVGRRPGVLYSAVDRGPARRVVVEPRGLLLHLQNHARHGPLVHQPKRHGEASAID